MTIIPLGLVTNSSTSVPAAVTLTSGQLAQLPPSGLARKVQIWANPSASGVVAIQFGGVTIAKLPVPANGHAEHIHFCDVDVRTLQVLPAMANDGVFVTLEDA